MVEAGYALFETPLGTCGIAWRGGLAAATSLPARADAIRSRLHRACPEARESGPPPEIEAAIAEIRGLLAGEPRDLGGIALDMTGVPDLHRRVYEAARTVRPGATVTYGEIAARIGTPSAARAVGRALGENPFPIVVPCHRVLAAGGRTGGFSAAGGVTTKMRMLSIEARHAAGAAGAPGLFPDLPLAARPSPRPSVRG